VNLVKQRGPKSAARKRRVFTASGGFEVEGDPVFEKHLAKLPKATRRRFYMSLMVDPTERWLNRQAAQGWAVVDSGPLRFGFERTPPGEYLVRCEALAAPYFTPQSQEYLTTLEESGAEIVAVQQNVSLIARRRAEMGPFELYSDLDSRIAYTSRFRSWVRKRLRMTALAELFALAILPACAALDWAVHQEVASWWQAMRELAAFGHGVFLWYFGALSAFAAVCALLLGVAGVKLTRELDRLFAERTIHE
jgi:hypothetical protein